jgi:uncharacterized membrane protein YdjX (TVP38/TMEM64 family)
MSAATERLLDKRESTLHKARRYLTVIGILIWSAAVVGVITCILVFGWRDVLTYISNMADEARSRSHVLDDLLFAGLISVVGIFGLPGMSMIELMCGFVLGFAESFILSTVTVLVVSLVAFWIGRYFFRDILKSYMDEEDSSLFKKVLQAIERRNGIGLLVLFRLMFIPFFIKNYGPSVIDTKFFDYTVAVVLTTPIYVVILTFLGSHAKTIADIATGKVADSSSGFGWMEIVPLVVSILAGISFTFLAYLEFRKLTKEEELLRNNKEAEEEVHLVSSFAEL